MAPLESLALPHCLGLPYWHYLLVLSWYLHQPESHQLSLQKGIVIGPRCPWSDLWIRVSITKRPFADLTDVTLADEDTNPILTDKANGAFQGNLATRVTQPGGQILNQAMHDQILNRFVTKCIFTRNTRLILKRLLAK